MACRPGGGALAARIGFGAILTSSKGLALRGGGGYPEHTFFDRTQLKHSGLCSSHLILRCLQLLQPVLTFGLLVLARFCFSLSALDDPFMAGAASDWLSTGAGAMASVMVVRCAG